MSSAAVQSSGPALANRQYQQQQSPQQFYSSSSPAAASASSSRKPARRPSGNGASPNTPSSPQNYHAASPAAPANSNLNTASPRAHAPPGSSQQQPAMPSHAASPGGPMPPPRSSSHRTAGHSPSTPQSASYASSSGKERAREDSASQSRRKTKDSPRHQSSSKTRHSPGQPVHSRSATAVGEIPAGTSLPREESTVINRIIVADPQEGIAREQARQAEAKAASESTPADLTPVTGLGLVGSEGVDDGGRGAGKSRQDHSRSERRSKFGNYVLGQTLGEGEFGKVKMGWKKDSSVEVAIKLIRRETLGSNQNRLQKIYREIHILRGLEHPNIVRLHEMVETERHIGIILEYASGGELFDYILNHRYLKDGPARRLFAQLVSGVGYLHRKGIVHRDLKLENLLLDRNRNIIITDFGFANTFDPTDELGEEIEYNLNNKEYIKKKGLEGTDGARRGDLMQTSCGSPCYAAPELVVSDSLYTGRKVDVWSCGVILYAMLAGYLPFDDDPANPEGDNINLLYKYIVSTPLTFPEYVTPHARDLLKRILVPDPRKRADLFEVAKHSWLSEYAHVVGFITSSPTASTGATAPRSHEASDAPMLARSASVREPGKPHTAVSPVGGLTSKREPINQQNEGTKTSRDNKRRTVQVEYVAPHTQTVRGEASPPVASTSKSRVRESGPTEVTPESSRQGRQTATTAAMVPPTRPARDTPRSVSDYTAFAGAAAPNVRPSTGGTLGGPRLPSRGNSYGQPSAATVAPTNAEGRFSQPKGSQYTISGPVAQGEGQMGEPSIGQPNTRVSAGPSDGPPASYKGHRRSSTMSETFGRIFGGRQQESAHSQNSGKQKNYPPTSMPGPMVSSNASADVPRQSTESSRRTSFGFSRKNTDQSGGTKSGRRFSLLPSSLSKTFTGNRESGPPSSGTDRRASAQVGRSRGASRGPLAFGRGESRSPSQSTNGSGVPGLYDGQHENNSRTRAGPASAPAQQTQFDYAPPVGDEKFPGPNQPHPASQSSHRSQPQPYRHANDSESSESPPPAHTRPKYPAGFNSTDGVPAAAAAAPQRDRPAVLQKNRRFADAYDDPKHGHHSGSSGSAKRVMDLFRRIGRQRGREDR